MPLSTQSLERKKVSGNQKRCYVCAKLSAAISVLGTQAALPVTENNHQRCACSPSLPHHTLWAGGETGLCQPHGVQGTCTSAHCSWLTSPGNRFPKTPRVTVENAGRLGRQGLCPIYLCVLTQSRLREWVMCYFTRKETEAQGDESCDLPQLTQLEME